MTRVCSIDGCERPARGRGWCLLHWRHWRSTGEPLRIRVNGVDFNIKGRCTVKDCGGPQKARGYCTRHYYHWKRYGDPLHTPKITGRPLNGPLPTWAAIHKRLERERGRAANCTCVDCGSRAAEWSYDGRDKRQVTGAAGTSVMPYSLDLAHYEPRCVRCHRRFDASWKKRERRDNGEFGHTRKEYVSDTPGVDVTIRELA